MAFIGVDLKRLESVPDEAARIIREYESRVGAGSAESTFVLQVEGESPTRESRCLCQCGTLMNCGGGGGGQKPASG